MKREKREHKVSKEVFKAPKQTIRDAAKNRLRPRPAEMYPSFVHLFMSPSQPHSKLH